jgi:hypothetical protein
VSNYKANKIQGIKSRAEIIAFMIASGGRKFNTAQMKCDREIIIT